LTRLRASGASWHTVLRNLAPVFEKFTPDHREHVAIWLAEVFGGPEAFTAELQALLRSN
jgi:hemoglobin